MNDTYATRTIPLILIIGIEIRSCNPSMIYAYASEVSKMQEVGYAEEALSGSMGGV